LGIDETEQQEHIIKAINKKMTIIVAFIFYSPLFTAPLFVLDETIRQTHIITAASKPINIKIFFIS